MVKDLRLYSRLGHCLAGFLVMSIIFLIGLLFNVIREKVEEYKFKKLMENKSKDK